MNNRIFRIGILLFVIALVAGELVYVYIQKTGGFSIKDKSAFHAKRILDSCAQSPYHPSCYDREIPKLMDTFSMEDTLAITKTIQSQDQSYSYCHVLGHAVSSKETKKDPSKWKDVITRCPSGVCSNGCVHGAFQERFRTDVMDAAQIESIKPELRDVCEPRGTWRPTKMEQATCYHALGHLLMYITGANDQTSTSLCDELAGANKDHDYRTVCYDGVFMQIFQPLEPEDIALVRGKQPLPGNVGAFCQRFTGEKLASCITESWPLFFDELRKPDFVSSFCGQIPSGFSKRCFDGFFYILVVQLRFDLDQMRHYCTGIEEGLRGRCFASTASRLIETDWSNIDKAVSWCQSGQQEAVRDDCFKELASNALFNFHPDSSQFRALCGAIPEKWKAECVKQ